MQRAYLLTIFFVPTILATGNQSQTAGYPTHPSFPKKYKSKYTEIKHELKNKSYTQKDLDKWLQHSVSDKNFHYVNLLLDKGADPQYINKNSKNCFDLTRCSKIYLRLLEETEKKKKQLNRNKTILQELVFLELASKKNKKNRPKVPASKKIERIVKSAQHLKNINPRLLQEEWKTSQFFDDSKINPLLGIFNTLETRFVKKQTCSSNITNIRTIEEAIKKLTDLGLDPLKKAINREKESDNRTVLDILEQNKNYKNLTKWIRTGRVWNLYERYIWIAYQKNRENKNCLLGKLPKEMLKIITSMLYPIGKSKIKN